MYDWQRREDTRNLLKHDISEKTKNDKNNIKQNGVANGNSATPSKQKQNYPIHHLNVSSNIFNTDSQNLDISAEKKIRSRSNKNYDHSPIFGYERNKTEQPDNSSAKKDNKGGKVRTNNTFTSQIFKQEDNYNENQSEIQQNNEKYQNEIKLKNRNASNKSQIVLSHKENNDTQTYKVFQQKKHIPQKDSNIFKPLTPTSARQNQYKIKDHPASDIFGEEPQECIRKPHPKPFEPLYSHRPESPAQKKIIHFYASRDNNGDIIPISSRIERCHTSHETRESGQNNFASNNQKQGISGSTSEAAIRNYTPQMRKQMQILGSFSEYKEPQMINKNLKEIEKYKNEIRSYNDKWWNKVEKAKNNADCFLSNKQIAEQQKYKQLKSDFFDEINNQIFGGTKDINDPNSITAEEIGVRLQAPQQHQLQQKKQKWQLDNTNEDQRRKDQQYSDLFGYGQNQAPQKNQKQDAIFPANFQSSKYDSIKFKTDYPSANISYQKKPEQEYQEKLMQNKDQINKVDENGQQEDSQKIGLSQHSDQRFYANLSSCLDQNGYRNNYSKNNTWKDEKNLKFDKYQVNQKCQEDQHNVSINFGCPKNDEGKNQRIIEIDFKNFSDKFDESKFKRYCSRKGIHLVDFQYDFNKLNNKIAGTGQLKIRDMHQDTSNIENVKDHLRQQGLVIKSSRVSLSTQSSNYGSGTHNPHKSQMMQPIESPNSLFNPNITPQQSLQLKEKVNKKNQESKGFKLLVTKKKQQNTESERQKNQTNQGNFQHNSKQYDTARSEIDTAKKVVENHNWKKAIDGASKVNKKNQEIRAKSALINRKTPNKE
ncbi:hypothetical protein ABPG72_001888 [Tetrahymena utriculariae]